MDLDKSYWENRWHRSETGWDIEGPAPAIIELVLSKCKKEDKILFPGAGSGHEAAILFTEYGYSNIYICDWAKLPLERFESGHPTFPKAQILNINYFELNQTFDYIVEQTFFCALEPKLRSDYVKHSFQLLNPNGIIMGLLFNRNFDRKGPPFGGTEEEYKSLFQKDFHIEQLELSSNSIKPRSGYELVFVFRKC